MLKILVKRLFTIKLFKKETKWFESQIKSIMSTGLRLSLVQ